MDVSQYLEIFIDETEEHLQTLSDCIMELEKEPENMDTINEIFRAAHSLKGMAGAKGFKRMLRKKQKKLLRHQKKKIQMKQLRMVKRSILNLN